MALMITDLLGSYDNFDEEPSYLNNPTNILAITITFMVSYGVPRLPWCCLLGERPRSFLPGYKQVRLTFLFQILSWIFALMRLYTRFFIVRAPGWDDLFVILSLVSTFILSSNCENNLQETGFAGSGTGMAELTGIDRYRLRSDRLGYVLRQR